LTQADVVGRAIAGDLDATGLRVAVVQSTFNESVTEGLLTGALELLRDANATDVTLVRVAGAFELPLVAKRLIETGHEAVIAIGAVVQGETDHYEHIAHRASEGLQQVMLDTGVPVSFGVLTVREREHALARAEPGPRNKGAEAAEAAVRTANALRKLEG
jgi:6,7-dimethyl-8-ribityllumazine synthase